MRIAARLAAAVVIVVRAAGVGAQVPTPQAATMTDSTRCDSVVTASMVDSTMAGLFISVQRVDGGELPAEQAAGLVTVIGASFIPPRPFRLTIFSGAPKLRFLRTSGRDSGDLRAPTVTGIYRMHTSKSGALMRLAVLRASLMPGFDTAAASAIRTASAVKDVTVPPESDDSMLVDVRFSTDSTLGARRLVSAWFPRMRVTDAVPLASNPKVTFPEEARQDSMPSGDIVLRFVVDRHGDPAMETVELVRGNSAIFLKAAGAALPSQHFSPAMIGGCAVAQLVEYAFNFLSPEPPPRH